MIVDKITLRVKNIIFFKIVLLSIITTGIIYLLSTRKDAYSFMQYHFLKMETLLKEAEDRVAALDGKNESLQLAIHQYQQLKATENISLEECFDKSLYQQKIDGIEKNFAIKGKVNIFASSNAALKKDQPKQSIMMKASTVSLSYTVDNMLTAIKFAEQAYTLLPAYHIVRSIVITRQNVITPENAMLFDDTSNSELCSTRLDLEVKEIHLNE